MKRDPRERIITAVRAADAWCHVITLPSTDTAELAQMVPLQIDELSPLAPEETVCGFLPLDRNGTGTRLLLALAPKAASDERVAALDAEGKAAEIVSVDAIAVFRALVRRHLIAHDERLHLFALLEPDGATLIAHRHGRPLLVRSLMAVDAGAVLAEAAHTRLALVLDNPDAGPGETVFAGPGAGDMFRLCSGGARALDADDVPSVADALREDAASGEADSFNLLSDEWRERRRRAQWRRQAVRGLLIAAGVYAVALVAYGAASLAQSARLAGLDRQIKQSQPEFAEARTVRHALQMLESRLDTQQTALEALLEASVQLPQSVRLTGFKFKKNETLTLRGETASASLALDYIGKLGQSPLFDNVKTVSMPTTPEGLTTFEVICRLKPVSSLAGGKS